MTTCQKLKKKKEEEERKQYNLNFDKKFSLKKLLENL